MSRRTIIALSCGALALGGALRRRLRRDDRRPTATSPGDAGGHAGRRPRRTPSTSSMKNNLFSPEDITVKVGQKIHWTNDDPLSAQRHREERRDFKSGNFDGGKTYDFTAKKAGRIAYVCTIHSGQKGAIVVTA